MTRIHRRTECRCGQGGKYQDDQLFFHVAVSA
jgi:hypothetical protein